MDIHAKDSQKYMIIASNKIPIIEISTNTYWHELPCQHCRILVYTIPGYCKTAFYFKTSFSLKCFVKSVKILELAES